MRGYWANLSDARKFVVVVLTFAAVAIAIGLASSSRDSHGGSGGSLSDAFCSDLKSGLTPFQILRGSDYSPEEAADRAYGFAAISCPEQLESNEALRVYLRNWDINPDA